MKLVDLIKSSDLEKVYLYISKIDNDIVTDLDLNDVRRSYGKAVEEMLSNKVIHTTDVIIVKKQLDWYYDYLMEHPAEARKYKDTKYNPDGSLDKEHYTYIDVNLRTDSNEEFGIGSQSWAELISMEIENKTNLQNEELLGEILWEITFHGFSESKVMKFWENLSSEVDKI